jgi:uncharacterized membrane protein (UPF0182 family)
MQANPEVRKVLRVGCLTTGFLVLMVFVVAAMKPYSDYLWYTHDVKLPFVFSTAYSARGALFALSFFPLWLLFHLSLNKALQITLVFLRRPESAPAAIVSNVLSWVQQRGRGVVRYGSPLAAFFLALGFANEWNTWLLARHGGAFGVKDPTYGLDLGFFVFRLPWYRALANTAFTSLLLATACTIGVYAGLQALAALAKIQLAHPKIRNHILWLVTATLLAGAATVWLKTYEIGLIDSAMFTGAGYAGAFKVGAERVFAVLIALVALATLANTRYGQAFALPIGGGILLAAYYLLVVQAVPYGIERTWVATKFAEIEAPYAAKAIRMTRFGYDLDKVEVRDFDVKDAPSPAQLAQSRLTLDNMRLWDPDVMKLSFESLQALRNYYKFDDVDIDRYVLGGKQTMVMLAPREIDPNNVSGTTQSWNVRRLRYTHGYGAVVAKVNSATSDGKPVFLADDIPVRSSPGLEIKVPQVYFGDRRDPMGMPIEEPAVVNTEAAELDYQIGTETVQTRWEGNGGVPISGFLPRLAFSGVLADAKLLVAPNLTGKSRLLRYRNVVERASKALPFLQFDNDPYLVIHEGRLIWMLDGYTLSDQVPYSAMVRGDGRKLNYIRNPVKTTVDAYSGQVRAYAIDPNEPILKAYRSIYPGLVRPVEELPQGLREHFRYPEDMLSLQCWQLASYHVADPAVFLSNGDAWQVAVQRGVAGSKQPIRPYYVLMRLPDEPKAGFMQILPFTPLSRGNLSGWIAAHCDPADYGRLIMYRFRSGSPPPGPELMETSFTSSPDISYINRTYNNDQSEVLLGNLLVMPLGDSVLYVEPLFLRSTAQGLQNAPPLFRVVLALKDRIIVRATYKEALEALFGESETGPTPVQETPEAKATAKEALDWLKQADAAMRAGNWAGYGEAQKKLRSVLEKLVQSQEAP